MNAIRTVFLAALLAMPLPAAAGGELRPAPHTLLVVDGGQARSHGWLEDAYGDLAHVTLDLADPASDPTVRFEGASAVVVELPRAAYPTPPPPEGGVKARKRSVRKTDGEAERAAFEAVIGPTLDPVLDAAAAAGVQVLWFIPPAAEVEPEPAGKPKRVRKKKSSLPPVDWLAAVVRSVCEDHAACEPLDDPTAELVVGWLEARLSFEPPPPPDLWDDQGFLLEVAQEAEIHLLSHRSEARDKDVGYMVFEPTVPDPRARFPVLYLLHGAYDGYTAWPDHAESELAAFAREFGLIIVTPDGDPFGWYVDSPVDSDSQIETYLFDELMPAIEADFPALDGRRAISGLSMGGHGALSLALRHPGTFVSASSMSGVLELTRHEDNSPELADRLGPLDGDPAFWEGLSVTQLLQARGAGDLHLRFTCGLQDRKFIDENQELHALLEELGIPHEYQESRGKHSWDYWTSQLETHLRFHAEYLSGDGVR